MSEQKPIDIEEQYERGYFYDVYTEALRLKKERDMMYDLLTGDNQKLAKENAALRESLKESIEALSHIRSIFNNDEDDYATRMDDHAEQSLAKITANHGELK